MAKKDKKEYLPPAILPITEYVVYSKQEDCGPGSEGCTGYCGAPCDHGMCVPYEP